MSVTFSDVMSAATCGSETEMWGVHVWSTLNATLDSNLVLHGFGSTVSIGEGPVWPPNWTFGSLNHLHQFQQLVHFELSTLASSSGAPSSIATRSNGRTVKPPSERSFGDLDTITENEIDLDVVLSWDTTGELREVVGFIRSPADFASLFVAPCTRHIRRSVLALGNQERLLTWNTAELIMGKERHCCMRVFQVPKKQYDRFIVDCTPLNRIQRKPPSMNITGLPQIFRDLLKRKFFVTIDATSYFYQFILGDLWIRNHFVFACNRARGSAKFYRMTRMAQGWKYSPCIGQRTSNVILNHVLVLAKLADLDVIGFVWLDNFIFAGDLKEHVEKVLKLFQTASEECNLECHPPSAVGPTIDVLGVVVNGANGTLKMLPKFVAAARNHIEALVSGDPVSFRQIARLCGQLVWVIYVRKLPLCFYPQLLQMMRSLHYALADHSHRWSDIAPLNFDAGLVIAEAHDLIATIDDEFVPLFIPPEGPFKWTELYSDASLEADVLPMWAYVSGAHSNQGHFDFVSDIYILELLAAATALVAAATRNPHDFISLLVDNSAVLFALRACHSGNIYGDAIIQRLLNVLPRTFHFKVAHVASAFNLADPFTRGAIADPLATWSSFWG